MNNRLSMFLLGATLAMGFSIAAYLLSNAIRSIRQETGIKVKGYAEMPITSDLAKWSVRVSSRDPNIKVAYAKVEGDIKTVAAKMKELGVREADFKVGTAYTTEERGVDEKGNATNHIEFYRVTQSIWVETAAVGDVHNQQKELSGLIKEGVELGINAPAFTYSKLEASKIELLGQASGNAYERAKVMVTKTGSKIGSVKSASQGVFQIVPRNSTDVSDSGTYDVSTIDKTVKAVVTMEFDVTN